MNSIVSLLPIIISLVEEAIKIEPSLASELSSLFANAAPTPADWEALRAKVQSQTFASLAPNAAANLPTIL